MVQRENDQGDSAQLTTGRIEPVSIGGHNVNSKDNSDVFIQLLAIVFVLAMYIVVGVAAVTATGWLTGLGITFAVFLIAPKSSAT